MLAEVKADERGRARDTGECSEEKKARRPDPARYGTAERQQPGGVDPEMRDVAVQELVRDERCHHGRLAARDLVGMARVARGYQSERLHGLGPETVGQERQPGVDRDEQAEQPDHDRRGIEHRLALRQWQSPGKMARAALPHASASEGFNLRGSGGQPTLRSPPRWHQSC